MPEHGMPKQDLATATRNLEEALDHFKRALRTTKSLRGEGDLFENLRKWRSEQAREKGLPPYIVATDAVLRAIEKARPQDIAQLKEVRGLGESKVTMYGEGILAVVKAAPPAEEEPLVAT